MIERYTRPEMGRLWSDEARWERSLLVEVAALEAWEELGGIPAGTAAAVRERARVDVVRIAEIEAVVDHDVAAFVQQISETCGDAGRWVHFGLTSNDVNDTAQGMALRDACEIIERDLRELMAAAKARALEHRATMCMGRSHGVHAEPTTFGAKLAGHAFEFARHFNRLREVRDRVAVGTISGPVGSYASVPPEVEAWVMRRLHLHAEPAPSQITSRDRHAEYLALLALVGTSCERLAVEIRHLARTEVREAEEPFEEGAQKGSSAMPHKRNPKRCERISGLARLVRGYAHAGWENVPTWHERDISQSSAERVALADASIVCDFMLAELADIVARLRVYPERMRRNMQASYGLCFSQPVLLALVHAGMTRDDAYRIVQEASMRAWDEERPFLEVLKEDGRATDVLGVAELDAVFDEGRFTANIGVVFDRLDDEV
jgi:adenylosuccinate lyase